MNETRALDIPTPSWAKRLLAPSRYKGAHGGRASGKSHFFAEKLVEEHVIDQDRNSVCVRQFQKSLAESSKKTVEEKIIALGVSDYFDVQQTEIRSRQGRGKIIFVGMQNHTAQSFKSLEGYDCAWVDEAQSLSAQSLEVLEPTIRKPRSELWFSWNPTNEEDPVDKLLRGKSPPPDAIVVEVNWQDNPWFPDVLRPRLEQMKATDPGRYAHVYGGEYVKLGEARVFHDWRIESITPPASAHLRFGVDFGFSPDPSVMVRCWLEGRTLYVDHEAYAVGIDTIDLPELFQTVPDSERWPSVADSSRPETISHLRKHGFPKMMGAVKGPKSLEEGVQFLRGHTIVVDPRCKNVIDELRHYRRKTDENGTVLPVFEDKHNHVIDALRYAIESVRRTGESAPTPVVVPTMNRFARR